MAVHLFALWHGPVGFHSAPTLFAITFLYLLASLQSPFRHAHHQTALKHEAAAIRADFGGRQRGRACTLVALCVGTVAAHDVVKTRAAGCKAARTGTLGVINAADDAHELAHGVSVVPRRTEGVLAHEPARREDDEVGDGGAGHRGRRREDSEDGGVWVIEGDGADRVEAAEIVLVRVIVAVPGNNVEWRVCLGCLEKRVVELDGDDKRVVSLGGGGTIILGEASNW